MSEEKRKVPKLRFPGFTEDWKQCKLGEVLDFSIKGNSLSRESLSFKCGEVFNIHYGDILTKYSEIINPKRSNNIPVILNSKEGDYRAQTLKSGDIVFSDAAEDTTVGKSVELVDIENEIIVAGLHTIGARPKIKFGKGFLGYYLNSSNYHRQLLPMIQGSKVSSINKGNLIKTFIFFPQSILEQNKITNLLELFSTLITLHQRKQYEAISNHVKTLTLMKGNKLFY